MLGHIQRTRRKILTAKTPYRAVLGDANNNPYAGDGYYWVRPYDAADENNIATHGVPYRVRSGTALVVPRGGRVVWVGYGLDQRLTVMGFDHDDLVRAGINPSAAQPNDPYRNWIKLKDIQNFRALPIGTGTTPSLKVQVRQLFYHTPEGDLVRWNGTNADTHIDLTDYVPADGLQRYVVLWLRTYNPNGLDEIQVTYSSTINSVTAVLSFTQLQECADAADADTIPIQAFRLANAQTSLVIDDTIDVDLRQFINMPQVYGFPNTVDHAYRVHEGFSVIAPSAIMIEAGGLIQVQENALLLILSMDSDESDPSSGGGIDQLTGDGTAGPGSGSQALTLAATGVVAGAHPYPSDVTVDAKGRVLSITDGSAPGTMSSFTVAGDLGTPQTITNGDTLSVVGATGGGITTGGVATDKISIAVNSTVIRTTGVQSIAVGLTVTNPTISAGVSGSAISNDATFASPSSTTVPTTNAVKGYVDQSILGLNAKSDVRLATAAALATNVYSNGSSGVGATLTGVATGVLTIDGVTVALNDRLLIKDEATGANNGVYKCTVAGALGIAYVLTRATDGDTDAELRGGWMVSIEGTANATQAWVNTNVSAITFGSTSITFGEFSAGVIAAGTGLTKTGNTLAIDSTVATLTGTQVLTGKTIDGDDNTLQDIPLAAIKTVGANTKRFITRDASGVISDATSPAFDNAQHTHANAANGGQLTGTAVNITAHNAVIGNGASGLTSLAPGTSRNVMISDGTDWASRALALADVPNLIAIIRDEKTSGTQGGTSVTTTWNARDLNTELYDPGSIVSISSNQFTPVSGDYEILVFAPFLGGTAAQSAGRCRLYNVTGAASVEEGMDTFALTNSAATGILNCKFTANGTDAYRIDTYTTIGRATTGLGLQVGDGSAEVYTCIMLRKVA